MLFVLSDGEPNDLSEIPGVVAVAEDLKARGVLIISCLLAEGGLSEGKILYGTPRPNWPASARLMFDCASVLEE
ncbi:hypothetical protein AB0395_20500 [Streptosporangium sp. NPDC051023]|uniref:hypothetical protein n=1 Tax=Streptosporangium sp. NPDC051023 TaxID=3155410 RepID=UPI00344C3711